MTRHRRLQRRALVTTVTLVILSIAAVLLRYQGLLIPVRIASGSMANRLVGSHRLVCCEDCRIAFRCGVESEAPLGVAVCPNCGFGQNELHAGQIRPGQRVIVDRWAYLTKNPRRRDVVAFVDPTDTSHLAVKRIVGLPQEAIMVRDGELFINDRLYRKTLEEAKESAILVYDDTFRPTRSKDLADRWQGDRVSSGWRVLDSGFRFDPADSKAEGIDWWMYRHWRCFACSSPRSEEAPVADNYGYNQGLSRQLHEVTDLFLTCEVDLPVGATLALLVHDGRENFQARLSVADSRVVLLRGSVVIAEVSLPNLNDGRAVVEFGAVDSQVLLSINGEALVRHQYNPADSPLQPTTRPLGIGASRGTVHLRRLRVFRDIYYLNQFEDGRQWSPPLLGRDQFLVLGDNVPLSRDSRDWVAAGLSRKLFIGKVLVKSR